jgi:ABC-type anion transport system duplicated permease subunit
VDSAEILLLVQIAVLAVLLGVVVVILVLDRRRKPSPEALEELKTVIRQSQELSTSFQEQTRMKIDLVTRALTELDDKIREARLVMEGLEKAGLAARQRENYTQADVQKLLKGGYEPVDISRITGIPLGEVQLMIRMNRQDDA